MIGAKILKTKVVDSLDRTSIQKFLNWHSEQLERYERLKNYYEGKQDIFSRVARVDRNANEKVCTNFCSLITDTLTGYFISNEIKYDSKDLKAIETIELYNKLNDSKDEDFELAKMMSVYGHSFEVVYHGSVEEGAILRFDECSPLNTFMLYDCDSLIEMPFACIRYMCVQKESGNTYIIDFITKGKTIRYTCNANYSIVNEVTTQHAYFKEIPVIEFKNNNERKGDFEGIISLQDAFNIVVSDRTNNVVNVVNSLLVFINYSMPSDTNEKEQFMQTLKKYGVIGIDSEGDAKYLSNELNSQTVENLQRDIKDCIHKISCTPDMSDEKFSGNATGVAMKYKLWNTEQKVGIKERKFHRGLQKRLRLISQSPKSAEFDWLDVSIKFTRNIPLNVPELVEAYTKLTGVISKETQITLLSFLGIEDPLVEMERMEKEQENTLDKFYIEETNE